MLTMFMPITIMKTKTFVKFATMMGIFLFVMVDRTWEAVAQLSISIVSGKTKSRKVRCPSLPYALESGAIAFSTIAQCIAFTQYIHTFTTISETTGDWICSSCALKCGIKTGIEGHEWKFSSPKSKGKGRGCVNENDNNDESSEEHSEESIQLQHSKRIRTNPRPQLFLESDSDSEDV